MKILVTGITGFLGKEFLKDILKDTKNEYILLVRSTSVSKISHLTQNHDHIKIEKGSLKNTLLFKDTRLFNAYASEVERVIHLAALYDLNAPMEDLYISNVVGTQNILYFCDRCEKLGSLDYASSIAVAGNWDGVFCEDDFDLGQGFDNAYSKTKFQAEAIVRRFSASREELSVRVIRFGVIVGNSQTGEISKNDGPYYFFSNIGKLFQMLPILKKLSFVPFPFKADSIFPIVPVDTAAALLSLKARKDGGLETIHCLARDLPTMKNFLDDFLASIGVSFSVIPLPKHRLLKLVLPRFSIPEALVEYLYMPTRFETRNINEYLPDRISYSVFRTALFDYVTGEVLGRKGS